MISPALPPEHSLLFCGEGLQEVAEPHWAVHQREDVLEEDDAGLPVSQADQGPGELPEEPGKTTEQELPPLFQGEFLPGSRSPRKWVYKALILGHTLGGFLK